MKIDVSRILVAQVRTMRDNSTQRYSKPDLLVFFGIPFLLSILGPNYGWRFNADVLYALLEAFSIFGGLLLNLLILVYTLSSNTDHPSALATIRRTLIKELHDNIAYSILVSIIIVIVAIVATAHLKMHEVLPVVSFTGHWMTGSVIFLTTNFFLTVLMILKRIYVILNQTLDKPFIKRVA